MRARGVAASFPLTVLSLNNLGSALGASEELKKCRFSGLSQPFEANSRDEA